MTVGPDTKFRNTDYMI